MSDSDLEEPLNTGWFHWFDSESDLPGILSVDSTIEQGVIVSSPSVDQIHVRALDFEESNAMGTAPNNGNPVGHVPLGETESCKGENFLDTPIHTPPQSKSRLSFPCHRGWAMCKGYGTKGAEKFYITLT